MGEVLLTLVGLVFMTTLIFGSTAFIWGILNPKAFRYAGFLFGLSLLSDGIVMFSRDPHTMVTSSGATSWVVWHATLLGIVAVMAILSALLSLTTHQGN